MTIQQLEYATLLQQTGSFSKAARQAGVSQSAISQQVSRLEGELGFEVFDRQTKPIKATALGARFLERVQLVLLEVQQLHDFGNSLEEEAAGGLSLGIIPTLSPYLVPFFIQKLQHQYPGIKLSVREMMTRDIVEALRNGELNAGIISTPISTQLEFWAVPLFFEKFYLYVSEDHLLYKKRKVAIEDVASDDLWLLNEGNCFSDQVNNMCQLNRPGGMKPQLEYLSNSIDALRRIVEHKGGITFLPELATLNVPAQQEEMIKDLSGPIRAREISLIALPNHAKLPLVKQVGQVIQESVPQSVRERGKKLLVKTNVEI